MANCKDCIHNNVCRNYEPISYSACSDFKDKSSIEKQIPKKPIYEDIGNIYGALKRTCANCGDVCMVSKCGIPFEHYCRYCGQKLNWSEEE